MASTQDFVLSTSTPTLIASGVGEVLIQAPSGATTVYLGDSGVSSTTGFRVDLPNVLNIAGSFRLQLGSTDEIYAVASAADTVRVLRTR